MRYLCNLGIHITVEAATLIGLTFVAATSYIVRSVMARKKKNASVKPPQPTTASPDAKGLAQAGPATVALPVIEEVDARPETS